METAQQKVDRLQLELDALNAQSPRNETAINQTSAALDEAKKDLEQEQAAQVRIQEATEQAAYFLDNLVIEGLTMRELCAGEAEYQMLKIAVQNKIINLAEENSRMLNESQAEDAAQQNELRQQIDSVQKKADEDVRQLRAELSQSQLECNDFESKLKNATNEIDRLNSQVDDLRKEIAVGARNAYKVIDSEEQGKQLKALADQIKANRIYVYDVEPDNVINPKNYKAKRADNGEPVEYNWTQAKNYIEIKEAAEVERFRAEHASKESAVQDSTLVQESSGNVVPEVTFPTIPTAQAPNTTGEVSVVGDAPEGSGQGTVTRDEFQALINRVVELEKVCNINEEAA